MRDMGGAGGALLRGTMGTMPRIAQFHESGVAHRTSAASLVARHPARAREAAVALTSAAVLAAAASVAAAAAAAETASPAPLPSGWCRRRQSPERAVAEAASAASDCCGEAEDDQGVGVWQCREVLGRGAHAVVYRGVLASGESIAVKQIHTDGMNASELRAVENEIRLMRRLAHPNVVRYLGVEKADNALNIFLEHVDGGSLHRLLQRTGPMTEGLAASTTRQILLGLRYLHARGITHRDVKGANILVCRRAGGAVVKLADFGASKRLGHESLLSGLKGTPHWMAPEVIRGQQTAKGWFKADVWSVGCTVVEMLTGQMPWPGIPNPMAAMWRIAEGEAPPLEVAVSPAAKDFVAACCSADPRQRHSARQLLCHTYMERAEASSAHLYPEEEEEGQGGGQNSGAEDAFCRAGRAGRGAVARSGPTSGLGATSPPRAAGSKRGGGGGVGGESPAHPEFAPVAEPPTLAPLTSEHIRVVAASAKAYASPGASSSPARSPVPPPAACTAASAVGKNSERPQGRRPSPRCLSRVEAASWLAASGSSNGDIGRSGCVFELDSDEHHSHGNGNGRAHCRAHGGYDGYGAEEDGEESSFAGGDGDGRDLNSSERASRFGTSVSSAASDSRPGTAQSQSLTCGESDAEACSTNGTDLQLEEELEEEDPGEFVRHRRVASHAEPATRSCAEDTEPQRPRTRSWEALSCTAPSKTIPARRPSPSVRPRAGPLRRSAKPMLRLDTPTMPLTPHGSCAAATATPSGSSWMEKGRTQATSLASTTVAGSLSSSCFRVGAPSPRGCGGSGASGSGCCSNGGNGCNGSSSSTTAAAASRSRWCFFEGAPTPPTGGAVAGFAGPSASPATAATLLRAKVGADFELATPLAGISDGAGNPHQKQLQLLRRHNSGYSSPMDVVRAAREAQEESERPADPMTGEFLKMEGLRRHESSSSVDTGGSGNCGGGGGGCCRHRRHRQHSAAAMPTAGTAPMHGGCSSAGPFGEGSEPPLLSDPRILRTKSAGVQGSRKLPPLEGTSGDGSMGNGNGSIGNVTYGSNSSNGCFQGPLRQIASAPVGMVPQDSGHAALCYRPAQLRRAALAPIGALSPVAGAAAAVIGGGSTPRFGGRRPGCQR